MTKKLNSSGDQFHPEFWVDYRPGLCVPNDIESAKEALSNLGLHRLKEEVDEAFTHFNDAEIPEFLSSEQPPIEPTAA